MRFSPISRIITALGFFAMSCTQDVEIIKHIDAAQPLVVIVHGKKEAATPFGTKITLAPGDAKYEEFKKWAGRNSTGWVPTRKSFAVENAVVMQGEFRLRYYESGVAVVSFREGGEIRQWQKEIENDPLHLN
jgi:hypothetical protein